MNNPAATIPELDGSCSSVRNVRIQTLSYFVLAVLGFSFWFFMAVPFAAHRESYSWLAMAQNQPFVMAFSFISKTYRPLAQGATWLGFLVLDPRIFPTSVLRQALLQGFIYAMFVLAWWLVYSVSKQRRVFSLIALVAGAVFFSGYVQLFHIYGVFYVPVMLTLGALLRFHALKTFDKHQVSFAIVAILLAFWHPFATALFAGFYFGFYLDTFSQRSKVQHVQAVAILLVAAITMAALVVLFPTIRDTMSLETRLFGSLVTFRTNEIRLAASFVAFLLTQTVFLSMELSPKLKFAVLLFVSALSVSLLLMGLPLLFLWPCAVLVKLFRLRSWSLFFLMLTAALLPFGGGIGTPIYALFAIVVATYVTALGWERAEESLSFFTIRYVTGIIIASVIVLVMVRAGIDVPIVTRAANPLLAEREKTYQLERILAWLNNSDYCGYGIAFTENADNPVDSLQSAISRRTRPPSSLGDVQLFWNTVLQCRKPDPPKDTPGTAIVTFGGSVLPNAKPVFEVGGKYAGDATVWIGILKNQ